MRFMINVVKLWLLEIWIMYESAPLTLFQSKTGRRPLTFGVEGTGGRTRVLKEKAVDQALA